jgi:nucleoside-diphosphate-sugar epimerase
LTLAQFLHTDGAWVRKSLAEGVAFNFAGQSANVLDIVRLISATMRYAKEPVILGQALDETPILLLDDMRTRDLLGWEPKVSLPAGIDATIAWLAKDIRPQRKELQ